MPLVLKLYSRDSRYFEYAFDSQFTKILNVLVKIERVRF